MTIQRGHTSRLLRHLGISGALGTLIVYGCASGESGDTNPTANGGSSGSGLSPVGPIPTAPVTSPPLPTSCQEAQGSRSYLGCDFWPTITQNPVWSVFDYAVVVANGSDTPIPVRVERAGTTVAQATIPPQGIERFTLPWIPELKGKDFNSCTITEEPIASVFAAKGAYHVVSDAPVTVFQFNPLQYESGQGAKWASCPGTITDCKENDTTYKLGCFSFSNDASILLPSSAWTTNYRVTGKPNGAPGSAPNTTGSITITASADNTDVRVQTRGQLLAASSGNGTPLFGAAAVGDLLSFKLNAGDVAVLNSINQQTTTSVDLSGSQVQSSNPVQVLFSLGCTYNPDKFRACDHAEESVWPAEVLGRRYFVTVPTGPNGAAVGHTVRFFGNKDGTKLSYPDGPPPGAPMTLDAGQAVELTGDAAAGFVAKDFEVVGDQDFAVASFMLGGELADAANVVGGQPKGDPSMSLAVPVEQFRPSYVFLAPSDYLVSYVDVVQPLNATLELNGIALAEKPTAISSSYGVTRVKLGGTKNGAYLLKSSEPVGIQVMGYGTYTSYHYPGGANLNKISAPPSPILR